MDSFIKIFPSIASEWNLSKNKCDPNRLSYGSHKKVWWICKYGHEWESEVKRRTLSGQGCPFCSHRQVSVSESVQVTHPDLVTEWHPEKNKILPSQIRWGSNKEIWWLGKCGHEWKTQLVKRTKRGYGCPYCGHRKLCKESSLSYLYPNLCLELHPTKNILTSDDVFAHSTKKMWWLCNKCNCEWEATVKQRHKTKCPICSVKSSGELLIKFVLNKYNLSYKCQFREYQCRDHNPLPFDFAVFLNNRIFFIEYQGEGHYSPIRIRGISKKHADKSYRNIVKHDGIKKDYCLKNRISLLCIPYWEKKNIEKLILEFIA